MTDVERDKEADLEKLSKAFFANLKIDLCEFGGIGLDSKRPFGNNSGQSVDAILKIIGWEPEGDEGDDYSSYSSNQNHYAKELYFDELIPYLQRKFG